MTKKKTDGTTTNDYITINPSNTDWTLLTQNVLVSNDIKELNLSVANTVTGTTLWFDDARIKKTSDPSPDPILDLNPQHQLKALNITYNAFKCPSHIEEDYVDKIDFDYNAFNNRSTMYYGGLQVDKMDRPLRKFYSADGSMEIKRNILTGEVEFVTYIGGDGYSAPVVLKSDGTDQSFLYLHRDYQGSIVAISDDNGEIVEKRWFDAWGEVVRIENGGGALTNFAVLDRGYTGHEHLMSVGLINMNARLYDPKLHRFLQPDNNLQNLFDTQNFNRYGYALNNPFKYTDPSGDSWLDIAGFLFSTYIHTAQATGEANPLHWDSNSWSNAGLGVASFAASGFASTSFNRYVDNYNSRPVLEGNSAAEVNSIDDHGFVSNYSFKDLSYDTDRFLRHLDSDSDKYAIMAGDVISSFYFPVALTNAYEGYSKHKDIYGREMGNGGVVLSILAAIPFGEVFKAAKEFSVVEGGGRAFWSGAGSEANALEEGFSTLAQTPEGKKLVKLTEGMDYYPAMDGKPASQAYQWWATLSTQYAKEASGTIHVFQNAQIGVDMQSIWRLYEYPALLKNTNVTEIIFHY